MQDEIYVRILKTFDKALPIAPIPLNAIEFDQSIKQQKIDEIRKREIRKQMQEYGQCDPIYVYLHQRSWILLLGREEYEVAKELGWNMLEAKILEGEYKEVFKLIMSIQRSRGLHSPFELAEQFEHLKKMTGWRWKAIAEKTGYSEREIQRVRELNRYRREGKYLDVIHEVEKHRIGIEKALFEIRQRKREEKGIEAAYSNENQEWYQEPYECPCCKRSVTKGETQRICNSCYHDLKEFKKRSNAEKQNFEWCESTGLEPDYGKTWYDKQFNEHFKL